MDGQGDKGTGHGGLGCWLEARRSGISSGSAPWPLWAEPLSWGHLCSPACACDAQGRWQSCMAASGPLLWDLTRANSQGAAGSPRTLVLCYEFCSSPVPLQLKLFKGCSIAAAFKLVAQPELLDSYHLCTQLFTEETYFPFPQLTLPLSLTTDTLFCQHFRCLLPCFLWAQSPAAKHTLKPSSVCSPERPRNKSNAAAGQGACAASHLCPVGWAGVCGHEHTEHCAAAGSWVLKGRALCRV